MRKFYTLYQACSHYMIIHKQVNDVCRMEYVIAKQHQLIGRQLPIPECDDLSPIISPEHMSCIRLGVQSEPLVEGIAFLFNLWYIHLRDTQEMFNIDNCRLFSKKKVIIEILVG